VLDETLNSLEQKAKLVRREWRREVYYYEIASEFLVPWIRRQARQRSIEEAERKSAEEAARSYSQELEIAGQIQRRVMNVTVPDVSFAKINAVSRACKDIGGDFFDLVYTQNGLSLIVADVSGKGISAVVVASMLQGMVSSQLARDSALPELIAAVNDFLYNRVGGDLCHPSHLPSAGKQCRALGAPLFAV